MSIWDKGKALSKPRLTDTFEEGRPFTLYGMELTPPVDFGGELGPTEVVHLTVSGAQQDKNGDWTPYGDKTVLGIISGPIKDMAAAGGEGDYPVVVAWHKVASRFDNEATVLQHVADVVLTATAEDLTD